MNWLRFLLAIVLTLSCLPSLAMTSPVYSLPYTGFGDTVFSDHQSTLAGPFQHKKGLFRHLKAKVAVLLRKNTQPAQATTAKKKTLTLVSLALVLLGAGLISLTGSLLPVPLALAGLIIGVRAVRMKREGFAAAPSTNDDTPSAPGKHSWLRRHLGLVIGLTLGIGGVVALFLALGSWGSH